MSSQQILFDPSLVIVFATAPAGLGHLRVTDALYHGLPKEANVVLLGAQDKSISSLYRFISIHPITRQMMEWVQHGYPEELFTLGYRYYLRSQTELLLQQLQTILDERMNVPRSMLIVATHFALAHQLAQIKEYLMKKTSTRIFLAVQVTDDSPQMIWYVQGADAIFVPSDVTRKKLASF